MSRSRHHSRSSEVAHIVAEVRRMFPEDAFDAYGIEILEDGRIIDTTYDQEFKTLHEWAAWSVDQESAYDDEDLYDTGKYSEDD